MSVLSKTPGANSRALKKIVMKLEHSILGLILDYVSSQTTETLGMHYIFTQITNIVHDWPPEISPKCRHI